MKSKIFRLGSLKAWLKRKRKSFSPLHRRYRHGKSRRNGCDSTSIVSGEPTTDDNAWNAQKTRHDDFDSSSLTQTLVQSNDSRSVSLSENTSCLEDSQGLPSPTRDTHSDRPSALSFLKKGKKLRGSPDFSPPESNNQAPNSRDSSSLASDNQPNHPQDLSPTATNGQPGDSHAISSLESDGEIKSYVFSSSHSNAPSRNSQTWVDRLVNLPYSLFLQIFCLVPPHEIVRSQRVSKALRNALTSQALSMSLILDYFPRAREARILRGLVTGKNCPEIGDNGLDTTDWATVFARLARRYWHLSQGKAWRRHKIVIRKDLQASHGVKPWNRLLYGHSLYADFHHWDPFWTCAPDQGLIIYPAPNSESLDLLEFRARDIETGDECVVPFRLSGGSLIRVHVSDGVLLFAFVTKFLRGFRFFIEVFDIKMGQTALPQLNSKANNNIREERLSQRVFSSRCRSQLFSMGRPVSHGDRFFCTHNRTHFALYSWIPTADPAFAAVNPLEELVVWDIGSPWQGPRPQGSEPRRILTHQASALQHFEVSQNFTPRLRSLELDNITQDHETGSACGHVYLVEDDHDLLVGPHSGPSSGVGHCVQSTGIPLSGVGPVWKEMCLGKAPDRSMFFSFPHFFLQSRNTAQGLAMWQRIQIGHIPSHDSCSRRQQCWRHENFPYINVSQAHDTAAGVRFKASQFFNRKAITVSFPPGIYPYHSERRSRILSKDRPLMNEQVSFFWDRFDMLMAKGRIYGDERWLVGEDKDGHLNILQF